MNKMLPVALGLVGATVVALAVAQSQPSRTQSGVAATSSVGAASTRPTFSANTSALRMDIEANARYHARVAPGYEMLKAAQALLVQDKLQEAEQKCREALEFLHRNDHSETALVPLELLGDIQLAKGEYKEALKSYAIAPLRSAACPVNTALCYVRLGDLEQAKKSCPDKMLAQYASESHPEAMPGTRDLKSMEATLLMALANIYGADSAQELKYYKAAEKLAPTNWHLAEGLGWTLDDRGRSDEAVRYYKRAVQYGGDKVSQRTLERAGVLKPTFLDGTPLPVVTPHPLAHETVKTQK